MPADETQKWTSPHGHAIASSETDKLTKTPENVSCENLTNADLFTEAVKVIESILPPADNWADEYGRCVDEVQRARDFLAKVR